MGVLLWGSALGFVCERESERNRARKASFMTC